MQLKSGGPKMTVEGITRPPVSVALTYNEPDKRQWYACQWFAGSKLEKETFPEDNLMIPSESEKKVTTKN